MLEWLDAPLTVRETAHHAARSGFGTATTLREHFARAVHTSPTAYRRAFRGGAR